MRCACIIAVIAVLIFCAIIGVGSQNRGVVGERREAWVSYCGTPRRPSVTYRYGVAPAYGIDDSMKWIYTNYKDCGRQMQDDPFSNLALYDRNNGYCYLGQTNWRSPWEMHLARTWLGKTCGPQEYYDSPYAVTITKP